MAIVPLSDFNRMIVSEMPRLRRYCISLCRNIDDGEDLMQDALMKAMLYRANFEAGTRIGAWLSVIARNSFLQGLRKIREILPDDGLPNAVADIPSPDGAIDAKRMLAKLPTLSPPRREILVMIGDEVSYEDIAAKLNIPMGTVKSRAARGRNDLRAI